MIIKKVKKKMQTNEKKKQKMLISASLKRKLENCTKYRNTSMRQFYFSLQFYLKKRNYKNDFISDHKIYLSFKELTVTLRDSELRDIGLCIVTGLVLSLENRFGVNYQKLSLKMESVNVEAANIEDDLVHVLKLVEGTSTIGKKNWTRKFITNNKFT